MASFDSGYGNRNSYMQVVVNPRNYNILDNSTIVDWEVWVYTGVTYWSGTVQVSNLYINGGSSLWSISSSTTSDLRTWYKLGSGSKTIPHNSDGTKNIEISAALSISAGGGGPGSLSISTSMSLPTIPRSSTISSFSGFSIGDNPTWAITRHSTSFTHWLRLSFRGTTILDLPGLTTTSGTLWAGQHRVQMLNLLLSNYNWDWAVLELWTYSSATQNESTQVGGKVEVKVKATGKAADLTPGVAITSITDGGDIPKIGTINGFVRSKSKFRVKSSNSPKYNATITDVRVKTYYGIQYGTDVTSAYIAEHGNHAITVTVTDSRGYENSVTEYKEVSEYYHPLISEFNVERVLGTSTDVKITYKFYISPLNNQNHKELWLEYRKVGEFDWRKPYLENNTANYSKNVSVTKYGILTEADSYEFRIWLRDSYGDMYITKSVGTAFNLINFNNSGKGIAFGKVSEKNAIELNMPTEYYGKEIATKAEYSYIGGWNIYKYEDGRMTMTRRIEISLICNMSWGSMYYSPLLSYSFPISFAYRPIVTTNFTSTQGDAWLVMNGGVAVNKTANHYLVRPDYRAAAILGEISIRAEGWWKL